MNACLRYSEHGLRSCLVWSSWHLTSRSNNSRCPGCPNLSTPFLLRTRIQRGLHSGRVRSGCSCDICDTTILPWTRQHNSHRYDCHYLCQSWWRDNHCGRLSSRLSTYCIWFKTLITGVYYTIYTTVFVIHTCVANFNPYNAELSLFNPLSPHDALKYYSSSLKNDLLSYN